MAFKQDSPIPLVNGGTGVVTMTTAYAPVCAGTTATSPLQVASTGLSTVGNVLTSTGASSLPTFQPLTAAVITLDGDTGSATGSTITIDAGNSTQVSGSSVLFTASGSTVAFTVSDSNSNTVIGQGSGNGSLGSSGNTSLGVGNFASLSGGGGGNTAVGDYALHSASTTEYSTAIGYYALQNSLIDRYNVAVGYECLSTLRGGFWNTVVGSQGASSLASGRENIIIGYNAGSAYTGAESNNTLIGSSGVLGESGVTRIIGINGVTVTGSPVFVSSSDQLGTSTSGIIPVANGGTGDATLTAHAVLIGEGTSPVAFAAPGATGIPLVSTGATSDPAFGTATVPGGGTGLTTLTAHNVLLGEGTSAVGFAAPATAGYPFISNGAASDPSFGQYVNLPSTTGASVGTIQINGTPVFHSEGGSTNIFVGASAGNFSSAATSNTALGSSSLTSITTGGNNVAVGAGALNSAQGGGGNSALGYNALNKAVAGFNNTASGYLSLSALTSGTNNSGFGVQTLDALTTGSYNVAIGDNAGSNYTTSESSNITINSLGVLAENNTLRIGVSTGTGNQQLNQAFISGINGITVTGSPVFVSSTNQLGTTTSGVVPVANGGTGDTTLSTHAVLIGAGISSVAVATPSSTAGYPFISNGSSSDPLFGNYINLPATTAANIGAIQIAGTPAFHAEGGATNIFVGSSAGNFSTASTINTGLGYNSLHAVTTGIGNVALGAHALESLATGGNYNTVIGFNAGSNYTTSEADNILINHNGNVGESGVIRLGTFSFQTKTFIQGITGVTTGLSAAAVLVDANGQLGTISSSIRYKQNVEDMGDASSNLLNLRPVTFSYIADPTNAVCTGLIAEEVAKLMPALIVYDSAGEIETVKYHELPALLLNELQKAVKRIEALEAQLSNQ